MATGRVHTPCSCDEGGTVVNYCEVCDDYLCRECTKAHRRTKLTKLHILNDIEEQSNNTSAVPDKIDITELDTCYCKKDGHDCKVLDLYCIECDQPICQTCLEELHKGTKHNVCALEQIYTDKRNEIVRANSILSKKLEDIHEESERNKEYHETLKKHITDMFDTFVQLTTDRKTQILNHVNITNEQNEKLFVDKSKDFEQLQKDVETVANKIEHESGRQNDSNKRYKGINSTVEHIQTRLNDSNELNTTELRFHKACPKDDLANIVQLLGCLQEHKVSAENSDIANNLNMAVESSSIRTDDDSLQSFRMETMVTYNQTHVMEVLKSMSLMDEPSQLSINTPIDIKQTTSSLEPSSIKVDDIIYSRTTPVTPNANKLSTLEPTLSTNSGIELSDLKPSNVNVNDEVLHIKKGDFDKHFPAQYVESNNFVSGGRSLLSSQEVTKTIQNRFDTWGLQGQWKSSESDVVMYSTSVEEAEHCMALLKECIEIKSIPIKEELRFLFKTNKWQKLESHMMEKHSNNVGFEIIDGDKMQLACSSTSHIVLKDVSDTIRVFLRDNNMQTITMTYPEQVIKTIMKQRESLSKLQTSYEQFYVAIKQESRDSITVSGVGIGLAQAMRGVHRLASKCYNDDDGEPRFESDDEDENNENESEPRFEDNERLAAVKLLNMTMGGTESRVFAICLPGDDKVLYVTQGDLTELPVEVMVNPADRTLKHNGGLAKIIVKKGGRSIQEECTAYVQEKGPLIAGAVFCSEAGQLPCSAIVHAVGPKWRGGSEKETENLQKAVYESLLCAARRRYASIAFPAIGTGAFGFPVQLATQLIVKTVKDFFVRHVRCSLRAVYFSDISETTVVSFMNAVKEYYEQSDIVMLSSDGLPDTNEKDGKKLNVSDRERVSNLLLM